MSFWQPVVIAQACLTNGTKYNIQTHISWTWPGIIVILTMKFHYSNFCWITVVDMIESASFIEFYLY